MVEIFRDRFTLHYFAKPSQNINISLCQCRRKTRPTSMTCLAFTILRLVLLFLLLQEMTCHTPACIFNLYYRRLQELLPVCEEHLLLNPRMYQ